MDVYFSTLRGIEIVLKWSCARDEFLNPNPHPSIPIHSLAFYYSAGISDNETLL